MGLLNFDINPKRTACEAPGDSSPAIPEPPQLGRSETFDEKLWRKFRAQPLIPIGCACTAYFLASGIKSFRDRDPVKSQRMMRMRIGAQFVTILCFVGYMGLDQFDWRLAPMYQEAKKAERDQGEQ